MKKTTFQWYKNWHFIFHMCVSLEPTTLTKNSMRDLNAGEVYIIFYAVMII